MINWTTNSHDSDLILKIAAKARAVAEQHGLETSIVEHVMDVTACHNTGMPLDLMGLLNADAGDFAHDVFGIRRHIDRNTGELRDCFVPRYSAA